MGSMTVLWQVASWALTLASARYLLPSDYGVLALAETFAPYLSLLATLSVGTWLIQATVLTDREVHASCMFSTLLSVAVSISAFLLCPTLARFYGDESLIVPFRLICFVFFLRGIASVPDAILRRDLRFKALSVLSLVVVVGRGVFQLALAIAGYGFWSLILGMLLAEVINSGVTLYLGRKSLRFDSDRPTWRSILRFGIPASLSTVCWILSTSADNVIVGKMFGAEMLGIYAMAYYLSSLPMNKINGMFRSVAFSYLTRLKLDPPLFRQRCQDLNKLFCILIFPVLCGMALVSEKAIPFLLGEKWRALALPLQVLAFTAVFRVLIDNIPSLLSANGNAVTAFHMQLLNAAVMPLSFFIGARTLGIQGVFGTWLFVFPLTTIAMIRLSAPALGIGTWDYLYNLKSPAICTAGMSAAVFLMQTFVTASFPAYIAVPIDALTGVAAYAALLFGVFRDDGQEFLGFFVFRHRAVIPESSEA